MNCMVGCGTEERREKNVTHVVYYDDEIDDKVEHVRKRNFKQNVKFLGSRVTTTHNSEIKKLKERLHVHCVRCSTVRMVQNITISENDSLGNRCFHYTVQFYWNNQ